MEVMNKHQAVIGVGSNLNQPLLQVLTAIDRISSCFDQVPNVATVYSSRPMGPQDQPDFINTVVSITTEMTAHAILKALQKIESEHGRIRIGERWGPRTLDLDLLLLGDKQVNDDDLIVPHVGIVEREFVVVPLYELMPEIEIPGKGALANFYQNFIQHDMQAAACWVKQ